MTIDIETPAPLPLDPFHVAIYCREALLKIEMVHHAKNQVEIASRSRDGQLIWHYLESLAGAITSVANIFWPNRSGFPQKRAADLREKLGLSGTIDEAVRTVRNGYIHFDERIDVHVVKQGMFFYVDRNEAPLEFMGVVPADLVARNFDISKWELSIFGSATELDEVFNIMDSVELSCQDWLKSNDPFTR